jgi:anti-sigma B factor antagonist
VPPDHRNASPPGFQLDSRAHEQALELVLAGDLDMAATFKLEPAVERLLAEHQVRRIALDLRDVRFIDSTGLGALLAIRERTKQLGIEMRLVAISKPVQRLLDMSGTASVLRE